MWGDDDDAAAEAAATNIAPPPEFHSAAEFAQWLTRNPAGQGHKWVDDPVAAGDVYNVAVYTSQPQDVAQVNGLMGYQFRGRLGMDGEFYPEQEAEPGAQRQQIFTYFADCTKSPSDDYMQHLTDGSIAEYIEHGTPVRKTDKAGAGTAGTRRYTGIGGGYYIAYSGATFHCPMCGEFARPNEPCPNCGNIAHPLDDEASGRPSAGSQVHAGIVTRLDKDVVAAMRERQFSGGYYDNEDDGTADSWRKALSDEEAARIAEQHLTTVSPEQRPALRPLVAQLVAAHHAAGRAEYVMTQLEDEERERGGRQANGDSDDDKVRYNADTNPKDAAEGWYYNNQERLDGYGLDREVRLDESALRHYPHLAADWVSSSDSGGNVHLGWAIARAASTAYDAGYDDEWHRNWEENGERRIREWAESTAVGLAENAPGRDVDEAEAEEWAEWERAFVRGSLPAEIREEVHGSFRAAFSRGFEGKRDELIADKTEELRGEAQREASKQASHDAEYGVPDTDISDTVRDLWAGEWLRGTEDHEDDLRGAGYNPEQIEAMFQAFDTAYNDCYDEVFAQDMAATVWQAELDAAGEAAASVERRRGDEADEVAEDAWQESRYANELHGDGLKRTHDTYTATFAAQFRELGGEDKDEDEDEGEDEGDEDEDEG